MRKLILSATFAVAFVLPLNHYPAAAASPHGGPSITISGSLNYSSILGGNVNGQATLSGTMAGDRLSDLRGSANLPLRDQRLTVAPTGVIVFATEQVNIWWNRWICDQFSCTFESGISIFERRSAQGPVEIRLGSLRGNGNLSMATTATCVEACPPPGAWWSAPFGFTQLSGGVTSSQDAGVLNLSGAAPVLY
jgi:hypothetical protein